MTTYNFVELTQRADALWAEGNTEGSLQIHAALLDADPEDDYLWYRTCLGLGKLGERKAALDSLNALPLVFAESGQLLLSLAAIKELSEMDESLAKEQLKAVGRLYCVESNEAPGKRPPPKPPARRISVNEQQLSYAEGPALRVLAKEACENAKASVKKKEKTPFRHHSLFSDLSSEDLSALVPLMELQYRRAGDKVIEQGEQGDAFFVVVRGLMGVSRDDVHLAYLRSGNFFGEMTLLTRAPRTAQVVCEGPAILFRLESSAIEGLAGKNPKIVNVLAAHTKQRLLRNLVATSPLFQPLEQERRESLVEKFSSTVFKLGETVVEEGDVGKGLSVVLSGAVQVSVQKADGPVTLAELGPGEIFGEMSLIRRCPATAKVTAIEKTIILNLSREDFNECVFDFPEMLTHVYKISTEREEENLEGRKRLTQPIETASILV
ncbi:MAG: cyclic nucleotide-binding domain-containing protein [Pseudomonadota bacterium]